MATPTVGSPGDNKAFADGAAVVLPVVIDATHCDFQFNSVDYTIPTGTYPYLDLLIAAINAAVDVSTGLVAITTVLRASKSPFTLGAIRFTAAAAGVNVETLTTGSSNDILATLGVTSPLALAHGATPISTGVSFDSTLTTNQTPPTAALVAGNAAPLVWTAVPTLQASWATKSGYQSAQYTKSADGTVKLRGVIDSGTKTAGTLITTLPAGFRPVSKQVFSVIDEVAATSNNAGEIIIGTDGTVKVGETALVASSYISFDEITFDAAS